MWIMTTKDTYTSEGLHLHAGHCQNYGVRVNITIVTRCCSDNKKKKGKNTLIKVRRGGLTGTFYTRTMKVGSAWVAESNLARKEFQNKVLRLFCMMDDD